MTLRFQSGALASATYAPEPTPLEVLDVCVCFVVGMAFRAVRLSRILCRGRIAPQHVDLVSHGFKVVRVAAMAHTAEMIQLQFFRDGTVGHFPDKPMNSCSPVLDSQNSVARIVEHSCPQPTRFSAVDFGFQSIRDASNIFHQPRQWVSKLAFVPRVRSAETYIMGLSFTAVDRTFHSVIIHDRPEYIG